MRRIIYVTALAVAAICVLALALCNGYGLMTQKIAFPGCQLIFGLTAVCASVIALVTQRGAMNPASRQTIRRIIFIQLGSGVFAGLGILVLTLAGSESAIGRAAIYAILAIAAFGAGFGMAYGYSLSWTQVDKPFSPTAPNPDSTSESR